MAPLRALLGRYELFLHLFFANIVSCSRSLDRRGCDEVLMIAEEDLIKAIDRIARTLDGELLYRYLQRKTMEVGLLNDLGTLARHDGERMFAARLMDLMRAGIDATAGRHPESDQPSERPVVFGKREHSASPARSFREWASSNDPELTGRNGTSG